MTPIKFNLIVNLTIMILNVATLTTIYEINSDKKIKSFKVTPLIVSFHNIESNRVLSLFDNLSGNAICKSTTNHITLKVIIKFKVQGKCKALHNKFNKCCQNN